jgi:hypothetical protein
MSKFRGINWNNASFGAKLIIRRSIDLAELGDLGSIAQDTSDLPTSGAAHRADHGGSTSATRGHTDFRSIAGQHSNVVDTQDMGLVSETTSTHRIWSSTGAITDVVTSAPTTLDNPPTLQAHTFTSPASTNTFTVPAGVTSITAVAIGAGGGGDYFQGASTVYMATSGWGGDLSYANNIPVTPGETLTVHVGNIAPGEGSWFYAGLINYNPTVGWAGESSWIKRSDGTVILRAKGGNGGGTVSHSYNNDSNIGDVSYSGGSGTTSGTGGGGGGAAGYAGDGGDGNPASSTARLPSANSGAGAGGMANQGGGGVGLYGLSNTATSSGDGGSGGGNAGSGGVNAVGADGGLYGGGAGGGTTFYNKGDSGQGAVRILWNGNASFPSTNVGLSDDEQYTA